jgi:hypothetical protein
MKEAAYIEKKRPDPEGLDFDSLKKEGIEHIQGLCGKTWTDYNLHDPGVTILEQLCYGLSDLVYRTAFDTADYLTGKEGCIDFEKQALYRPQDIFPSHPTTMNDYRKVLFDSIEEIKNVWVRTDTKQDGRQQGLYSLYVRLQETVEPDGRDQVLEKVRDIYAEYRNLCEDLKEVSIIEPCNYALHGDIEIDGTRDPGDLLAEIYFRCSSHIAPGIVFYAFEEMLKKGKSLEEIFTGPKTVHGYIEEDELDRKRDSVTISDMIGIISSIKGVRYIENLWFSDDEGKELHSIKYDPSLRSAPSLRFPSDKDKRGVRLFKNERELLIEMKQVTVEYDRLNTRYQVLRQKEQDLDSLCALPKGAYRNLRDYYSIQNDFPAVYGINRDGVPESEPPGRKARARQLKAYLLFFEQVMANYLETLQQLPRLFSPDEELEQTSFYQVLKNEQVPRVEELYRGEMARVDAELARIEGQHDRFGDRRNRILDYLLALYGEKFTQKSLRHFYFYDTEEELHRRMIRNKINFLKHIVDISRKRTNAFNYRKPSWNTDNVSGLKKKASILLDLPSFETRSLTEGGHTGPQSEGFHMVEHILLRPLGRIAHDIEVPDSFYSFRISLLFPSWPPRFKDREYRKLAEETVCMNCPAHIYPEFHWLESGKMQEFEKQYKKWLDLKSDMNASVDALDGAAQALIAFLLQTRSNDRQQGSGVKDQD